MIIALRTDRPESELYLLNDNTVIDQEVWSAHRELSSTLLIKIELLLNRNNLQMQQLSGIVVYQGPGSFTGLRIGITVANTLAYSLSLPISGSSGENWLYDGVGKLIGSKKSLVIPVYGAEAHITKPRK